MEPLIRVLLAAVALLPARYVFDERAFLAAIRDLIEDERERVRSFAGITEDVLHDALIASADAGLVREIEIEPGRFLIVRTERRVEPERSALSPTVATRFESGALGLDQPDPNALDRALRVSIDTVALRQAILSPTMFVWPAEDYAALLEAVRRAPSEEQ